VAECIERISFRASSRRLIAPAMRFWESLGFSLIAVHQGAVDASRKLKPEIPLIGIDGVRIRDKHEYELTLQSARTHPTISPY
jgi:hypothetical protein